MNGTQESVKLGSRYCQLTHFPVRIWLFLGIYQYLCDHIYLQLVFEKDQDYLKFIYKQQYQYRVVGPEFEGVHYNYTLSAGTGSSTGITQTGIVSN